MSVLIKLQGILLDDMQRSNWPITFSIGVLTCTTHPSTIDELIKVADELMYSAKLDGKNRLKCAAYAD